MNGRLAAQEADFLLQQPTEGALDGEDAVGGVFRREAGDRADVAQRRSVHAFQGGRDEMAAKQFVVRVLAHCVAGALEPFEDAQDEFLEPGAVKDFIRCLRVLQEEIRLDAGTVPTSPATRKPPSRPWSTHGETQSNLIVGCSV